MDAAKTALVEQVKTLQRTSPESKQAWWDYCDNHLGGVRDPAKHDASTLAQFVTALQSGVLPKPKPAAAAAPKPARAAAPKPAFPAAVPAAAAAFAANPALAAAMAAFSGFPGGFPGAPAALAPAATPAARLQDMVKTGQRHSQHWRTAWQTYCALYGTGFNDPAKYEEPFLVGFMDYIGQLATTDLNNIAAEHGVTVDLEAKPGGKRALSSALAPPAKKVRVDSSAGPAAASADPEKAELVEKVKALQRANAEAKVAWQTYCDTHMKGIKDPSRHESSILQQFVAQYS